MSKEKSAHRARPRTNKPERTQVEMQLLSLDQMLPQDHQARVVWAYADPESEDRRRDSARKRAAEDRQRRLDRALKELEQLTDQKEKQIYSQRSSIAEFPYAHSRRVEKQKPQGAQPINPRRTADCGPPTTDQIMK